MQPLKGSKEGNANLAADARGGHMADVDDNDPDACVLCVAEKPSVARAIAEALSGGKHCTRNKNSPLQVHLTYAYFPPAKRRCSIAITSVVGHVFGLDFAAGAEKAG